MAIRHISLFAVVIAAWVGASSVSAAQGPPDPTVSHKQWDDIVALTKADQDTFAGVSVDGKTGVATVYLTEATSQSARAVHGIQSMRAIAASRKDGADVAWSVQFGVGHYSVRELTATMETASRNQAWQSLAKPYLADWYIDARVNSVRIELTRITPEVQSAATRLFGDRAVLGVGERMVRTNRQGQWDGPPWWGGDSVEDSGSTTRCSAAFGVWYQGYARMMTAGHCWLNGNIVYQPSPSTGSCMGSIFGDTYGGGSYDIAVIDLTYCNPGAQGYVYYSLGHNRPVGGMAHAYIGDQACFDGARTEENCSGYENADDECAVDDIGVTICHLARASSNTLTVLAQQGDSGGPVYEISGSKIYAQGMISGILPSSGGITAYFSPMWRADQDYGYVPITCGC